MQCRVIKKDENYLLCTMETKTLNENREDDFVEVLINRGRYFVGRDSMCCLTLATPKITNNS